MSTPDPGLDRHEWESELETLRPELESAPEQALPDLAALVERMLTVRGYDLADPVAVTGGEREVVAEYMAARETVDLVESGGADPGEVAAAVRGLLAVFDGLVADRSAS